MVNLAAKIKYRLFLNLGLLGFNTFLSLFENAIGKPSFLETLGGNKLYNYSVGSLVDNTKSFPLEKLKVEKKDNIFLTLKIFSDKQYDYDQNIYLAEGNVKALINGGLLRSDLLSYEKSTGILSAQGNVRFNKNGQYFRGKEFRFNLKNKEGFIQDSYGILDVKNVLEDLKIDSNLVTNRFMDKFNNKEKTFYDDGIEFSLGNIKVPQNKITKSNKSSGSINNWRFKSDLITIHENGWKSNRINFTNDPFDPNQISFEGINVIAEEDDDGQLIITSSKTNLVLGRRTKIFLGKRKFGEKKKNKSKFELMFDGKDRDGLVLIRRSDNTKINKNLNLNIQPQFLLNRALLGKTNSYKNGQSQDNKNINFSDLLGLNIKINSNYKGWIFDSLNDISTFNSSRIFSGIRHSSTLKKSINSRILNDSSFNIFTNYRSRAWNGTIGETEIKSAYGGFFEKIKYFEASKVRNNLNIRLGTAKYDAEKLLSNKNISLWRSSIFASLDSEYEIWKMNQKNISKNKDMFLSPVLINPDLLLKTNIKSAYFTYEDGSNQGFIKFSFGPEIRLGRLQSNFLDYTKLSIMPGLKIKAGNSPFKFDNAIDLRTLNISLTQQIYGPLIFDLTSDLNIDNGSDNYGDYYDTKVGLLWHKRAYEFGIYYHPNNYAGGLYFRLNGFNFDKSVNEVF